MIHTSIIFLIGLVVAFLAGYTLCRTLLFQGERKDHIGCGVLFAAMSVSWSFMLFLAKTL